MTEPNLQEESSQPEIELYLGSHHYENSNSNEIVVAKVAKFLEEEITKDEPRSVYAYLELEGFGQTKSEMFAKLLDEGNYKVLEAFTIAVYSDADPQRRYTSKNNTDLALSWLKSEVANIFKFHQLESLSKLRDSYKDKKGNPLLEIAIEPTEKKFEKERDNLQKQVSALVDKGEFDAGVEIFKQLIEAEASAVRYRELEITKHIKQIIEQNPRAIIMRYGTGHDTLQTVMLNESIKSKLIYINTPNIDGVTQRFIFSKSQELVNRLTKDMNSQITEVEWYQAMILDRLVNLTIPNSHTSEGQIELNKQNHKVELLSSLELINLFQKHVKDQGFVEAFKKLADILNTSEN